jgi:hypothetical protein
LTIVYPLPWEQMRMEALHMSTAAQRKPLPAACPW